MSETYQVWFRDTDSEEAIHSYDVIEDTDVDAAAVDAFVAALQGVSTAAVFRHNLVDSEPIAGAAAVNGPYDIADKAVFIFRTTIGTTLKWMVPAPLQDIFLDDDVIDDAHALVVSLVGAAVGHIGGPGGELAQSFVRGYRDRRNRSKS